MHVGMYACYAFISMHACMSVYAGMHACVCIGVYMYMYACMYACMWMCGCVGRSNYMPCPTFNNLHSNQNYVMHVFLSHKTFSCGIGTRDSDGKHFQRSHAHELLRVDKHVRIYLSQFISLFLELVTYYTFLHVSLSMG